MATLTTQPDAPRNPLDNTSDDPTSRAPLVLGDNDFKSITDKVAGVAAGQAAV